MGRGSGCCRPALTAGGESEDTLVGDSGVPGPGVQFLTTADSLHQRVSAVASKTPSSPAEPVRGGQLDLG